MEQLKYLIEKYLDESITSAEKQQLSALLEDPACSAEAKAMMLQQLSDRAFEMEPDEETGKAIRAGVIRQISQPVAEKKIHYLHHAKKYWVAASIVAVLVVAWGAYRQLRHAPQPIAGAVHEKREVLPGREGAILTLDDNTKVLLDTIQNGVIALQNGARARVVNGELVYEGAGDKPVYNTVSTPKGRQFHLTLPDGTGVWLNAASTIRFPTVFTATERRIDITGEAYFEVAANVHQPFRVNVNSKATVEVLGTRFNVNAYENEASINTTLIDGAVRVQTGTGANQPASVVLKPAQQAQITTAAAITVVNDADIDKAIAWKNGYFNFENATLHEVMRQLERWYDIEVVYEKNVPDIRFIGEMTKDIPLSGLLVMLEKSNVHFKLEGGRKLVVMP